jgi:TRAP-type C4-dicarboxylate transport system permease small subunit
MDIHAATLHAPVARPTTGLGRVADRLDRVIGGLVETVVAVLVFVEMVILAAGVTARYVFHAPLVWSDELASILFLWLSMLGSVVALRRGEHMRMTGLVSRVSPGTRALLEALAITASIAFLLMIIPHAIEYAEEESFIVTPALEITNAWRAAALPVGMGLMLLAAAFACCASARSSRCCWLSASRLHSSCCSGRRPHAEAARQAQPDHLLRRRRRAQRLLRRADRLLLRARDLRLSRLTTSTPMIVMVGRLDEGMSHLILLAVPLFIFLGALIEMTGMAKAMIQFLASLLGHVRGGLSYVLVGAMYLVSGISGSKIADMAAIAPVLFPGDAEARRQARRSRRPALGDRRADRDDPALDRADHHRLGHRRLDRGAVHRRPAAGVVLAIWLCCVVVWWRYRGEDLSHVVRMPKREIAKLAMIALPAVALPFVIRAAVVEGVATATEVSTIGIVYSVLAGLLLYRQFDWRRPPGRCWSTRPRSPARSSSSSAAPPPWPGA